VKLEELRKAQENKEIKKLENQLMLIGISSVSLSGGEKYGAVLIDKYIGFLKELFADKESQKIFREYSKKGIMIFVGKKYQVYKFGYVTVDVNDGVKSIAEKLKR